jgi:predicted small integral membrane protein
MMLPHWMAWTWQTAAVLRRILSVLAAMTAVWEVVVAGRAPRHGVSSALTPPRRRLFISLLGSAFIHLCLARALSRTCGGLSPLARLRPRRGFDRGSIP